VFNPLRFTEAAFDAWCDALERYTDNEIEAAVEDIIKNFAPASYKPFPVPADVIEHIRYQREDMRRVIFSVADCPIGNPPPPDFFVQLKALKAKCLAKMTPGYLKTGGNGNAQKPD
jgi:hypothetical protein